ncbi:MAG TPA: ABC transporter permease [Amycolatopsis sp.]|nr:ABC transporter permease [Amycolatopsis sp.]
MNPKYLALEMRRVLRSPRFLIFTVAFPVLLFVLYVGLWGKDQPTKTTLMVSMTAFGAMAASLTTGARVAVERNSGWQRQLRLTPLTGRGYLSAKAATGMLLALAPVVLVPLIGGVVEGVSLDAGGWLRVTLGVWLAAIPFALLGLLIGQVGTVDSTQPLIQLVLLPMALLGGIFIPVESMPGWLLKIAHVLPTYWMGEIGRSAAGQASSSIGQAVLILAIWSVALSVGVIRRYRRDSARV